MNTLSETGGNNVNRHTEYTTIIALGLVSAALLNFEILLSRHIAIAHWHHLIAVIIGIALLGFGIAGSLAAVFAKIISYHYLRIKLFTTLAIVASFPVSQMLASFVPLNMLALPWYPTQYLYLLLYACSWLPPFLLTSFYIAITFMRWPGSIAKLYGADLFGAALGAILALVILEFDYFSFALLLSPLLVILALLLTTSSNRAKVVLALPIVLLLLFPQKQLQWGTQANSFKEFSVRQNEADARLLWQQDSAHSRLSLLTTSAQHASPGLSINSTLTTLPQWQLFVDGDNATALLLDAERETSRELFMQSAYAAPYQLLNTTPAVLLLGTNASWNSWTAYWHEAKSITLLDRNKNISTLLDALKAMNITGADRKTPEILPQQVKIKTVAPRRYIAATNKKFDLIVASVGSNRVGTAATKTNFIMTRQGLRSMFEQLSEHGILTISNFMAPVPKDNLRVINTLIELLTEKQLSVRSNLVVIRDWRTIVLMISPRPFNTAQIEKIVSWSQRWRFDLVTLPGLKRNQSNLYHINSRTSYFDSIIALMGEDRDKFIEEYLFDITPTNDDKPYLYHSFRWQKIDQLKQTLNQDWPRLVGWGFLLSLASLLLLSVVALFFIILPLCFQRQKARRAMSSVTPLVYFSSLGIGFMAIEIALLQQVTLLLNSPTSAFAIVLSAMLLGSGLGSLTLGSKAFSAKSLLVVIFAYAICLFGSFAMIDSFFQATLNWSPLSHIVVVSVLICCLAFPLGLFLPYGLNRLAGQHPSQVAWCWGINGFASVMGVLLAPIVAMALGISGLLSLAICCYLIAGLVNMSSKEPMWHSHNFD
ncbi:hypothetical protein RI844_00740 [Thalassotalea fonticola]|uniref:Spermidine synthase n=1 Tax=Thalassotalea fonticola TaxID=3065649 RepID=A0ABZ0GPQ6_9GAMM|nr:hypothetical protein RI844_00740 [Colwelliaceae bacterium S1-1]